MFSVAQSFDRPPLAAFRPTPLADSDVTLLSELFEAAGSGSASPDIAHRLLGESGSLAGALATGATDWARLGIPQEARRALVALRAAVIAALRRPVETRPCLASSRALIDYLHADMAYDRIERFRVLFLNNRNVLIRDEVMSEGSVQAAPVFPREVVRRALDLGASALILVHNHTSGDPQPSGDDIAITRELVAAAGLFGISVHDHLIIGRQGHVSLSQLGYLG